MEKPQEVLFGLTSQHLTKIKDRKHNDQLHRDVVADFTKLQIAASDAGFDLQIASGFRSFERQVTIWNRKFSGETPCLDKNGQAHNFESYSDQEKVFAILEFSALPGLSRHHWGTDFDYYDPSLLGSDTLQLIANEYEGNGVFAALNEWLTDNMHAYGFFRPYREDIGGVAKEPWHLSHISTSQNLMTHLRTMPIESLKHTLKSGGVLGYDVIAANIETIIKRYGLNICPVTAET